MKKELELFTCCICKRKVCGYGNNPWPVKEVGKCCDECNIKYVLPARIYSSSHAIKGDTLN